MNRLQQHHWCCTGLTSAMYLRAGHEGEGEQDCTDPGIGLFVRARGGEVLRVRIKRDQIVFQAGECLQIMSGGLLHATPHMVRGAPDPRVLARNTFAVFIQPKCVSAILFSMMHRLAHPANYSFALYKQLFTVSQNHSTAQRLCSIWKSTDNWIQRFQIQRMIVRIGSSDEPRCSR